MEHWTTDDSLQVAKTTIAYVKWLNMNLTLNDSLVCPDCRFLPMQPVTGNCGHTRCKTCIVDNGPCCCGCPAPKSLRINIVVQDLITKMIEADTVMPDQTADVTSSPKPSTASARVERASPRGLGPMKRLRQGREYALTTNPYLKSPRCPIPDAEFVYKYAQKLNNKGRYKDAAPHLATAAALGSALAREALKELVKSVTKIVLDTMPTYPAKVSNDLCTVVRTHFLASWLPIKSLECIICYDWLYRPVTTLCGHIFCRDCIVRTIAETQRCAVCRHSLDVLSIVLTNETAFVTAALPRLPYNTRGDLITIFKCTVAFPSVSYPILVLSSRQWAIFHRILGSGTRRIGVVSTVQDGDTPGYGTIVEVRDCLELADGRIILSTLGISRFQVLEEYAEGDCNFAQIHEIKDYPPSWTANEIVELKRLADVITSKSMSWLSTLSPRILNDITDTYGPMPFHREEGQWWMNPQCAQWIWWIVAILPIRHEIQVLMLSSRNLEKRLHGVIRALGLITEYGEAVYTHVLC